MDFHKEMRSRVQNRARSQRWYEIRNAAGPKATIRIYEEIGYFGVTAEDFAADLEQITSGDIEVQINSPGGEVFAGIAIYNALRTHPARVTTRVDGIAASAASVIAQAGDHRVMLSSSQMMIHEAWGLAIGPAADMREMADLLDRQSDVIAGIYAERSGGDQAKFRDLMAGETWLTDEQTVENGLADEVVKPERQDQPKDALTEDRVRALIEEATASLKIPPPIEEEEAPAPAAVDAEQAERLLSVLTFNKENQQ